MKARIIAIGLITLVAAIAHSADLHTLAGRQILGQIEGPETWILDGPGGNAIRPNDGTVLATAAAIRAMTNDARVVRAAREFDNAGEIPVELSKGAEVPFLVMSDPTGGVWRVSIDGRGNFVRVRTNEVARE